MNPILRAIHVMDSAFNEMESMLPPPQKVKWNDRFVFRYIERMPEQALLLKLARNISDIRAIIILFEQGYFQEQAVIQRPLDEILEDMIFLSFGIEFGFTDIHDRFLEAF